MSILDDDLDGPPAPLPDGTVDPITGEIHGVPLTATGSPLDVRNNIARAFEVLEGWKYLVRMANSAIPSDRSAFMSMLAKTVPAEVKSSVEMAISVSTVNYAAVRAAREVIETAARIDVTDVSTIDYRDSPLLG
jgi:hypothetical protein